MPCRVSNEAIADLITDLLHLAAQAGTAPDNVSAIVRLACIQHEAQCDHTALSARPQRSVAYNPGRQPAMQ